MAEGRNLSGVLLMEEGGYEEGDTLVYPETEVQNVMVLSFVLLVALAVNLMALPVILFRRTKFGNGLFAVLILCLTISDVAVIFFSVLGSLVVEASHLLWGGAPGSCQIYHWLSAWVTGLSAYLLVAIVGMVMVKTTTSCLQRLRDCRWLLLALLVTSGLYALPELFIRSTVDLDSKEDVCILGARGAEYALYVAFRLTVRHVIPAILVIVTVMRPETKLSKRVSHLFFGHLSAAPCSCGDDGKALRIPHECPNMQTAMLKAAEAANTLSAHRPDVIADSEPVGFVRNGKVHKLIIQPEDSHRRKYKLALSVHFLIVTILNFAVDLALQIQSVQQTDTVSHSSSGSNGETLATALYALTHLQQIGDPIIFLVAEFVFS